MVRSILSIFMGFWLAISPLFSYGQSFSANDRYAKAMEMFLDKSTFVSKINDREGWVDVFARDEKTNKEFTFQVKKSSEAELREFDPEELNKKLAAELKQKVTASQALVSATKRFPMEAGMFFVALGAVSALQLFTDYSSNPARMEQHLQHSASPIGQLSFWSFVAANGVSANAMQTIIKNPKFHWMIPNLSMTAGYFVSSTISVFAADPNVKACAQIVMGKKIDPQQAQQLGIDESPCKAAYSWYSLKGKAYELTPGLISLLASNAVTLKAQQLLMKGAFRYLGWDLMFLFTPGGVGIKGMSFVVSNMVQMAAFTYIDVAWLNHFFTFNFKNIYDGKYLARLDQEVTNEIIRLKKLKWVDPGQSTFCMSTDKKCRREHHYENDLAVKLKELQKGLADWRMVNLAKVYEAHMGWQQILAHFNAQYDSTQKFYEHLVYEVVNSKLKKMKNPYLDRVDPLYGIKAQSLTKEAFNDYYLNPLFTYSEASYSAQEIGQTLTKRILHGYYTNKGLMDEDIKVLTAIATKLSSSDYNIQGQGVALLNETYSKFLEANYIYSHELREELIQLSRTLGWSPRPIMRPGQGFFARYENFSLESENLKSVRFPKIAGMFETNSPVDYMTVQAMCGPDLQKNEKVTQLQFGGKVSFIPPRLINGPHQTMCAPASTQALPPSHLYAFQAVGSKNKTPRGVIDALIGNILPELLEDTNDEGKSALTRFWENKVDPQVQGRYIEFESYYQKIILMLNHALKNRTDADTNSGPAPNGVIDSMRQQMRLNLVVLGEIIKDLATPTALPSMLYSKKSEPQPSVLTQTSVRQTFSQINIKKSQQNNTLLWALRADLTKANKQSPAETSVYDFSKLASTFTPNEVTNVPSKALKIQKDIEFIFESIFWMIQGIKYSQYDNGRIKKTSSFKNSELEVKVEELNTKMSELSTLMGINNNGNFDAEVAANSDSNTAQIMSIPNRSVYNMIESTMSDLLALAQEAYMYGSILNAVDWENRNSSLANDEALAEFAKKQQEAAQKIHKGNGVSAN